MAMSSTVKFVRQILKTMACTSLQQVSTITLLLSKGSERKKFEAEMVTNSEYSKTYRQ